MSFVSRNPVGRQFINILPLLDELQTIARNGLAYTTNPYDRERYEHLLELVSRYYGDALDLPPREVRQRLSDELGYITPKDKLEGKEKSIFAERDRKLAEARERRKAQRQGARQPALATPSPEPTTTVT